MKRVYYDKTKAPSEKSSNMTNRKSPTSSPMSLRRTSYVAPNSPKGASKATILSFPYLKNGLCWKKVCCKVCLCENCQRQTCKAFTRLSICAEMVGGRCPLLREILGQNDPLSFKNGDFHSLFARSDCIVTKRDNCL